MAWVLPGNPTTLTPIASAWGTDVNGDLTILETQVGLFGQGGAMTGSAPSATTPAFLIQAGTITVSATSANFSFSLPATFPNGLLAISITPTEVGNVNVVMVNGATATTSTVAAQYFRNGSALTGSCGITYIAIGF